MQFDIYRSPSGLEVKFAQSYFNRISDRSRKINMELA